MYGNRYRVDGFCFKNLSMNNIENSMRYYSGKLVKNKIIGFRGAIFTKQNIEKIVLGLGKLSELDDQNKEFYWVSDFNHEYLNTGYLLDPTEEQIAEFEKWSMHVDIMPILDGENNNLDERNASCYVAMHMQKFTCDPKFGKTSFLSLIKLYNECPGEYKNYLNASILEHHSNTDQHGNKLEPNSNPQQCGLFYPYRTHPVTKETILFWPSFKNVQLNGDKKEWFIDLKNWIMDYLSDKKNWYDWSYEEGDLLIWDNRAILHSFSPGWKNEERIFDQLVMGFQIPYYDELFSDKEKYVR